MAYFIVIFAWRFLGNVREHRKCQCWRSNQVRLDKSQYTYSYANLLDVVITNIKIAGTIRPEGVEGSGGKTPRSFILGISCRGMFNHTLRMVQFRYEAEKNQSQSGCCFEHTGTLHFLESNPPAPTPTPTVQLAIRNYINIGSHVI
jgi:hypothetical protein